MLLLKSSQTRLEGVKSLSLLGKFEKIRSIQTRLVG